MRLGHDRLDLVVLHLNDLPVDEARPLFDAPEREVSAGRVGAMGWSTDFPASARALSSRDAFVAVQHAMNVFFSAPDLLPVLEEHALVSFARSPLAMGLLTGKYGASSRLATDDVRSNTLGWMSWFERGRVAPRHLARLEAVRECLQEDGRTLARGALA